MELENCNARRPKTGFGFDTWDLRGDRFEIMKQAHKNYRLQLEIFSEGVSCPPWDMGGSSPDFSLVGKLLTCC